MGFGGLAIMGLDFIIFFEFLVYFIRAYIISILFRDNFLNLRQLNISSCVKNTNVKYIIISIVENKMKIQISQQKPQKTSKISKPQKPTKKKQLSLEALIKKDKNFEFTQKGKIRCKLTNHEMTATVQNYQNHTKSKSYKRALEKQYDISQYELILVDFKGDPGYFYCQLTGAKVAKKKSAVQKHINGKRFKNAYEQLKKQEDQQYGSQQQGSAPLNELEKLANDSHEQQQQIQQEQQVPALVPATAPKQKQPKQQNQNQPKSQPKNKSKNNHK